MYNILLLACFLLLAFSVIAFIKMVKKLEAKETGIYNRSRSIIDHCPVLDVEPQKELFSEN